jgi:Tfp pilus assembly protein PilN
MLRRCEDPAAGDNERGARALRSGDHDQRPRDARRKEISMYIGGGVVTLILIILLLILIF